MEVTIYQEPCWVLEAAELVYGLVNGISAEKLAGKGPYCVPPEEVRRIQEAVCAGIDPGDKLVQFYFRGVALEGLAGRLSCLGCALLYSTLAIGCSGTDAFAQAVKEAWRRLQETGFRVNGIDGFSLSLEAAQEGEPLSLAGELAKLQAPPLYQMQLLEVFTAFDRHLDRVIALLRPVAEALPAYLAPWTGAIPVLTEQWSAFFHSQAAREFFLRRARIDGDEFLTLEIAFRFFSPQGSPGKYSGTLRRLSIHMGVGTQPGLDEPNPVQEPEEWELTALWLLANASRMEMLHAMMERPMSGQELAQKLNLNSGTVFRDLNSLYNARLLLVESGSGRNCYRLNLPVIRQIVDHVLHYLGDHT